MLSIKNLVFKGKLAKKITERYMRLYIVEKVVLRNIVKLKLIGHIFQKSYLERFVENKSTGR